MAAGTMVSRILGFLKTALIGVALGATASVTDIFQLANQIPNLIYLLVAGGVFNAVLVPQVIKASRAPDRGADYISRLLTLALLVMGLIAVAVTLAAGPIMNLIASDWSDAQLALGTVFAFWCLPQIFFYGLYAVMGQVLNAHGSFGPYMWAPAVNNIVAIVSLVVFIITMGTQAGSGHSVDSWTETQTLLLVGGATLGVVAQTFALLWPLRRLKLGLRLRFGWRGIGLGTAGKLAGWTLITMVVGNSAYLFYTHVASAATGARASLQETDPTLQVPGLYALDTANMLYLLPHSVVALSIATVLFNRMAHAHGRRDTAGVKQALNEGLRTIGVANVFAAVAFIVLAGPLGRLFSGASAAAGAALGQVLLILALGLPFLSVYFLMGRVFYAAENAKTPLLIQCVISGFGVTLALLVQLLPAQLIVPGLALTYALCNVAAVALSHRLLKRRIGNYGGRAIVDVHIRMSFAAIGSAVPGSAVLWLLGGMNLDGFAWHSQLTAALSIIVVGIVMALAYAVLLRVLGVTELRDFLRPLLARLRGGTPPPDPPAPPPGVPGPAAPRPPVPARESGKGDEPGKPRAGVTSGASHASRNPGQHRD